VFDFKGGKRQSEKECSGEGSGEESCSLREDFSPEERRKPTPWHARREMDYKEGTLSASGISEEFLKSAVLPTKR